MKLTEKVSRVLKNCLSTLWYKKVKVLNSEQTLDLIIKNRLSIARYGDGEMDLMIGKNINFQKHSKELENRLKNIKTNEKLLVCIPNVFSKQALDKNQIAEKEYIFWKKNKWLNEYKWKKYFSDNKLLGDAFVSRFYIRYKDKSKVAEYIDKLKRLWQDRDVVFVEGENSRLGYGNDLFDNAKSIKRILCPTVEAFEKYEDIMSAIKKHSKTDDLLILALGPTATVMAFDLSEMGYQALDLGHVDIEYEWFKMGAREKCPIPHKHVNECSSMGEVEANQLDKKYLEEIVCKI